MRVPVDWNYFSDRRLHIIVPDPQCDSAAGSGKDGETRETDDSYRNLLGALHGARHHRHRLLYLRTTLPHSVGDCVQLSVRDDISKTNLRSVCTEIFHVFGGGYHVGVLDLEQ